MEHNSIKHSPILSSIHDSLHQDVAEWESLRNTTSQNKNDEGENKEATIKAIAKKMILFGESTLRNLDSLESTFSDLDVKFGHEGQYQTILREIVYLKRNIEYSKELIEGSQDSSELIDKAKKEAKESLSKIIEIEEIWKAQNVGREESDTDEFEQDFDIFPVLDHTQYPHLAWESDLKAYSDLAILSIDTPELIEDIAKNDKVLAVLVPFSVAPQYQVPKQFLLDISRSNQFIMNGVEYYSDDPYGNEAIAINIRQQVDFYEALTRSLGELGAQRLAAMIHQANAETSVCKITYEILSQPLTKLPNSLGLHYEIATDRHHVTVTMKTIFSLKEMSDGKIREYVFAKKVVLIPLQEIRSKDFEFKHLQGLHVMEQISPPLSKEHVLDLLNGPSITEQTKALIEEWTMMKDSLFTSSFLGFRKSRVDSLDLGLLAKRVEHLMNSTLEMTLKWQDPKAISRVKSHRDANKALNALKNVILQSRDALEDIVQNNPGNVEATGIRAHLEHVENIIQKLTLTMS